MSKVICDVCGTSYPEMSTQCPICGSVRPADAPSVASETKSEVQTRSYQHVKGGRFSKSNVRKRNASAQSAATSHTGTGDRSKTAVKKKNSGNTGLIITIFVLLLAILAVIGYIAVKFFIPTNKEDKIPDQINTGIVETEPPTQPVILCQEITLDTYEITLNEIGQNVSLNAATNPEDTTENISFVSDNEAVVTVDDSGVLTAVDYGEAVITVTCGNASAQCSIVVEVPFVLDMQNITFDSAGAVETIYTGTIDLSEITWSTDDASVAVVADGVVTAVGNGTTSVHATYKENILSCTVTCNIADAVDPTDATQSATTANVAKGPYKLKNLYGGSSSDVTLRVGERFSLALLDANGDKISDVKWTVEDGNCCTVSNGDVKAVSSGHAKVVATYNGETFSCIVRVS